MSFPGQAGTVGHCSRDQLFHAVLDLLGFLEGFIDGAYHVESLLWQMITLASHNHFEAADGLSQRHVLAWRTR